MRTQVIIIDIFNKEYLQRIDFTVRPRDSDPIWTKELTQCSFYEEEDIPKILRAIDDHDNSERWIECKVIHVKGDF